MKETFASRFGLLTALIGMAVGTGNIWRFPRVMSQNGGGAFLIPWLIFLLLWSIPLLTIEFALGKKLKQGVVGCFSTCSHGKLTWLGGFVVFCTLGIMFYYSVVTGWCLSYLIAALNGVLFQTDAKTYWKAFTQASHAPLFFHIIVILITAVVILRGVRSGIETISRIMIPSLFAILIGLAGYAMTLSGSQRGIDFILDFDLSRLKDYKVWLEALTQSAWSTGAGWGLALTYACYARAHDHPVRTPFITGFSNNCVEILAVLVILPTLFSFFALPDIIELTSEGNTGLTFIALPKLFQKMRLGPVLATFFFLALFFAAFTSLVSMFELGTSFLRDIGIQREKAVALLGFTAMLAGAPSAFNMDFFDNQDWVWGIGLLVSGLFFTILVRYIGGKYFISEFVGIRSKLGSKCLHVLIYWVIPIEFLALLYWWFYQAIGWDKEGWWHPLHPFSIGTCLLQWGILLALLLLFNKKISGKIHLKTS